MALGVNFQRFCRIPVTLLLQWTRYALALDDLNTADALAAIVRRVYARHALRHTALCD